MKLLKGSHNRIFLRDESFFLSSQRKLGGKQEKTQQVKSLAAYVLLFELRDPLSPHQGEVEKFLAAEVNEDKFLGSFFISLNSFL